MLFDPWPDTLFDESRIDSATAAFNADLEQRMTRLPARFEMPVTYERTLPPGAGMVPSVTTSGVEEREVPGPAGPIPIRVQRPSGAADGVYLHLHPGGFCLGAARHHDAMLAATAEAAGVAVISADYRLAPENPYPAGPADCEAVAVWLIENAAREFGTDRIVIGGESAGAVLSVTTALRLRDRHGYSGLAGVNLSQGAYDLRMSPGVRSWGSRRLVLDSRTVACHFDRYLPPGTDREDPGVSPIFADLSGMPPALFTVGTLDPLLEDNVMMHFRWRAAGGAATLAIHPGGVHGFTLFDTAIGQAGRDDEVRFIRDRLAAMPSAAAGDRA